jgi:hypothetical protein
VVTLTDVLTLIESNDRVCPQPQKWYELYRFLPNKRQSHPAVPLILGGWWHSTPAHKQERLREHVEWAAEHGALDSVFRFLSSLREDDGLHLSEAPSGRVSPESYEE